MERAENTEHERHWVKAILQQFHGGQLSNQAALLLVQPKIFKLGYILAGDHICLISRLEECNNQNFTGLPRKSTIEVGQAKTNIYEKSKKTVNVYTDGWQMSLNLLRIFVSDELLAPASAVKDALHVFSAHARSARVGHNYWCNAGTKFQFNGEDFASLK